MQLPLGLVDRLAYRDEVYDEIRGEGDLLLFTALGGGLAWASAMVRW